MSEIVEAARGYWSLGLPAVPLRGKQPLVQWAHWQMQPQTEAEFNGLPWNDADGFAVICGSKTQSGLYFAAVDFDVKNLSSEAIEKGREALKNLPITQIEETPSGGQHWIYLSHAKPKSVSAFHNLCGLELIGEGKLCIMAPSKGYRKLNDNTPSTVANLEAAFKDALCRAGIAAAPKTWFKQEKPIGNYKGPEPPCIKALIQGVEEGLRNEVGIRLASYLLNFKGLSRGQALAKLQAWNNRNCPPMPSREVEAILKSAEAHGYIFGCEDQLLKTNCKEAECPILKGPKKIVRTPSAELPDGRLIEEAFDGENIFFLVYDPKTGLTEQMEHVETEDCIYKPVKNLDVKNGLTLLPSRAEEYESEEELFRLIVDFLNSWHEAPSEFERKLDAFYVFLSYVYDLLPRVPYRRALGSYGRGKSAWMDTVGSICYRPIILAGCDTDKAIVRRIHLWRGTALIDEADFDKSSLYAFIVKILNIGYDRRLGHYTRADDVNPQKTISYNVFGPKLLATREEFRDKALESRCLTFVAREKTKPMPLYRDKKFLAEAQALRNKLILWRFRKYPELKAKAGTLETPELETELTISSSRIKEVIAPLLLLNPQFKDEINALAQELEAQIKASDPDWQLEEQFNDAILRICAEAPIGASGSEGLLVSRVEDENATLNAYLQPEPQRMVLRIPLVKISKIILDNPDPDPDELKSLNQKLSRIAKNRLALKVLKDRKRRSVIEVGLPYKPSAPIKPIGIKTVKVVEVDDLHPLERSVAPVEAEIEPEVEPDEKVKPSEGTEVEGEGRPRIRFGMMRWARLHFKISDAGAWKAAEFTHRCQHRLPMDLTFPDGFKVEVRGPLTWFMARVKAVEFFGKWRRESSLTRDSTVPGCIGTGEPIPPNTCENCRGDLSCFDLPDFKANLEKHFNRAIKIRSGLRYADVSVYLCETPYRLTVQGQKALLRFIIEYIENHKSTKRVFQQLFGIADDWASFTVLNGDVGKVRDGLIEILTVKGNVKLLTVAPGKVSHTRVWCLKTEVKQNAAFNV
ncbi:MAG: bifunctional DNA primase/polymerase [Candidatus Bathyarchaeia archaeon]